MENVNEVLEAYFDAMEGIKRDLFALNFVNKNLRESERF